MNPEDRLDSLKYAYAALRAEREYEREYLRQHRPGFDIGLASMEELKKLLDYPPTKVPADLFPEPPVSQEDLDYVRRSVLGEGA